MHCVHALRLTSTTAGTLLLQRIFPSSSRLSSIITRTDSRWEPMAIFSLSSPSLSLTRCREERRHESDANPLVGIRAIARLLSMHSDLRSMLSRRIRSEEHGCCCCSFPSIVRSSANFCFPEDARGARDAGRHSKPRHLGCMQASADDFLFLSSRFACVNSRVRHSRRYPR